MKIYTKTGDRGQTGLFGGQRVPKSSLRVSAYGEVDELNSVLGLARIEPFDEAIDEALGRIQSELFDLGAELGTVPEKLDALPSASISDEEIARLEEAIDGADAELPALTSFVLPGGTRAAAQLHVARCVCRRAERRAVALAAEQPVRGEVIRYLNRLSDLLFTWARLANHRAGVADVPWRGRDRAKG